MLSYQDDDLASTINTTVRLALPAYAAVCPRFGDDVFGLFGTACMRESGAQLMYKLILPRKPVTDNGFVHEVGDGRWLTNGNFHFQYTEPVPDGTLIQGAAGVDIVSVDVAPVVDYDHPYMHCFHGMMFGNTPQFRAGVGDTAAEASVEFCRLLRQVQALVQPLPME